MVMVMMVSVKLTVVGGGGVSEKTNGNMDVIELNASCSDLYG